MLRSFSIPAVRALARPRRSFVSAVLLSKSWDRLSLQELRIEAKNRGIPSIGKKSTLISRIQEHEKSLSYVAASSTANVSTPPETPSVDNTREGETPGIPLAAQAAAPSPYYTVYLPEIDYSEEPEPPIQIPYSLDFWTTSAPAASELEPESTMPKMVVIGGEETYGGASPTHNMLDETQIAAAAAAENSSPTPTVAQGKGGFLDDVAEDMGLPHLRDVKKTVFRLFT
ncbi:hypothetical protein D9757_007735 [Collybiopsis confluens]|uniref:SAP domain-containing protein n=1 Tax=Collybiopsis confluens TaxID=2823264 RepID=A0A8H5M0S8_9AGAR|nr:hypothetical protein D9757_007735 [Collybiopsis confluens]